MGLGPLRASGAVSFVALVSLTACSSSGGYDVDDISEPGTPSGVMVVSGNNQTATAGTLLPAALVGKLRDVQGNAVPNRFVTFVVVSGGGSVASGEVKSDANGLVQDRWTLGAGAGVQKIEVRSPDTSNGAVIFAVFEATATAGAGVGATAVDGTDGQAAKHSTPLPNPVGVSVVDLEGNAKAGVLVTFTPCDTCGSVEPKTAVTNAGGIATTSWTLGANAGAQRLSARPAGLADVTFGALATSERPAAAASIAALSGGAQTVEQHARVAQALRVFIADSRGAGVAGVAVEFAPAYGSTPFETHTIATNTQGIAEFGGFFHAVGAVRVEARAATLEPVTFDLAVTASAYDYDGEYACRSANAAGFSLSVARNQVDDTPVNADGTFASANLRGHFTLGTDGVATADGTRGDAATAWACERR